MPSHYSYREACEILNHENKELRTQLRQAAMWFEEYAEHHEKKGDIEKADRNAARALFCRYGIDPTGVENATKPVR
jgi:hypothetical protein